jgi:hypothetical protein
MRGARARDGSPHQGRTVKLTYYPAVYLHQTVNGVNATTQLASLKGAESWKRDTFIEEGGWVTLPGVEKPVTGAASLCAQQLLDGMLPLKPSGATG